MIYPILHTISQYTDTTPLSILTGDGWDNYFGRVILVLTLLRKNHSYYKTAEILNTKYGTIKEIAERHKRSEYAKSLADYVYWLHYEELSTG